MGKKRTGNTPGVAFAELKKLSLCEYYMGRFRAIHNARMVYNPENADDFSNFDFEYFERVLFQEGVVTVWFDTILGSYLCGRTTGLRDWDFWGNPTKWDVIGANGNHLYEFTPENAVLIYDSLSAGGTISGCREPVIPALQLGIIAEDLANARTAMRLNVRALNFPIFFTGSASMQLTFQNLARKIDAGEPYYFIPEDAAGGSRPSVLDLGCRDSIATFSQIMANKWAEGLSVLGVNNVGVEKGARLNVPEVTANDEEISIIGLSCKSARQKGFDKIAEVSGRSRLTVEWRGFIEASPAPIENSDGGYDTPQGGENNGSSNDSSL